jgi:drug/metabolite transporter (DMT)-like permease
MPRSATLSDWTALFALTVFWGTSFLFIELALQAFPPAVLVLARIGLGAFALAGFMALRGVEWPRSLKTWASWAVIAVLGVLLPMSLVAWGQQHIDSAEAGVLMAISPLFVYTLGHFLLPGERLTPWRLGGFLFGFAGVVLVIGPGAFGDWSGNAHLLGALAVLGSALSYSLNSIYARRIATQDPMALATGMMLLATVFAMPTGLSQLGAVSWPPGAMPLVAIAILGLICSGFASVLYFRLIQGPGPGFTTLVTYLVPAWAVLAGSVVLQEDLSSRVYLGLGLILGGIGLSEFGGTLRSITRRHRGGARVSNTAVE